MTLPHAIIRIIALVGATSLTPCWADNHPALQEQISLHLGNRFAAKAPLSSQPTPLEVGSAPTLSLGYALEEAHWRIEIELNRAQADLQTTPAAPAAGQFTSTRLFYNVFWLPAYNTRFSGVIGAGLGYGRHAIKDIPLDANTNTLADGQWVAKWVLGAEYKLCSSAKLQLIYEKHYGGDLENKTNSLSVELPEQGALQLGAVYRF